MESFSQFALIFTMVLLGIGILGIIVFGTKNIANGKHKIQQISFFLVPVVVFGISYLVTGFVGISAIYTLLIMLALMMIGMVVSGSRNLISNF